MIAGLRIVLMMGYAIVGDAPAAVIDLANNGKTTQVGLDILGRGGKLVQVGVGGGEVALSTASMIFKLRHIMGSATGSLGDLRSYGQAGPDGSSRHLDQPLSNL